jgi:hypothetical protein
MLFFSGFPEKRFRCTLLGPRPLLTPCLNYAGVCVLRADGFQKAKARTSLPPLPGLADFNVRFSQVYWHLETSSRDARTSALTILVSSRSCARWPPVQAFLLTRCLPSGDLGPVDLAHGIHCLINSACRALRSGVQVVAMICLQ